MNNQYLTWQAKAPCRAGLYIRTDGFGKVQLLNVSVQSFLDGSSRVYLTDVSPGYARGPMEQLRLVHESIDLLPGDERPTSTKFLGPIALPSVPSDRSLSEAQYALPAEPGIYLLSRDYGHGWVHQYVAISIHRYLIGETPHDELIAIDLPSLERRELKGDERGVILTLVLPEHRRLNLQMLPAQPE